MPLNSPQLKQLYITGYILSYSGWYFNHAIVAGQLSNSVHEPVLAECEKLIDWIKGQSGWFFQNIPHVNRVAEICGLHVPQVPQQPDDYFKWAEICYREIYQLFPTASAEQLSFNLGYNLGNISCSLELLKTFLYLNLKLSDYLNYNTQLGYLVTDINASRERLDLIGTLLAALPDTVFAQQAWLSLAHDVQQILSLHPEVPDAQQHLQLYQLLLEVLPNFHHTWTALLDNF
jgi:hypothetical protein